MECANRLLGHPYSFNGTVITGHQIGRNIGFPTANINILGTNKVLPKEGVYAVKAKVNDKEHLGVANWGRRPTFELGGQPVLEVHLLDFNDNIYSQTAEISFMKYIREEKQFSSPEELQRNVQHDIDEVNLFFSV
jgi:riboflavin kinase/FMN adenylyltransferase